VISAWLLGIAGSLMVYADDDHVTVVSPSVSGQAELGRLTTSARYTVDAVSAASVDLVTAASPRGFEEIRHQVRGSGDYALGGSGARLDLGYGASVEPDFVGHGVDGGYRTDLLDRHATVSARGAFRYATVMHAHDPELLRTRTAYEAELAWSHVLGRRSVADLGARVEHARGYLANPYRLVRIHAPAALVSSTAVAEAVPDTRTGAALTGRLRALVAPDLHALGEYRFSRDTWGISAHTATARGTLGLWNDRLLVTLEARGYLQGAADFHRTRYESFPAVPEHRTADKELGRTWTALAGLDVEWSPTVTFGSALRLGLGFDAYYMRYPQHPTLRARTAGIGTVDVTWEP
jgi:hypothetical protein